MLELEKWGRGKPIPLVMMAQSVAVGAEACFDACVWARENTLSKAGAKIGTLRERYRCYRQHRRVMEVAADVLLADDEDRPWLDELAEVGHEARRYGRMGQKDLQAEIKGHSGELESLLRQEAIWLWEIYQKHLDRLERDIRGKLKLPSIRLAAAKPEVFFFLGVSLPCWIEYGKPIARLLRKARNGDVEAVEDLLRLDKAAIDDPRIRQQHHEARARGERATADRFVAAFGGKPTGRFSIQRTKIVLAAWVFRTFAEFDMCAQKVNEHLGRDVCARAKLDCPELQRLFDAAAKDMHGRQRDTDLPDVPDSFYHAINRELKGWPKLVAPTLTKLPSQLSG